MRVISGEYKRFNLFIPKNIKFRPTTNKVKEAIFSSINSYITPKTIFLDLFCGSGSIGIEALSRNVANVYFVDNSTFSIEILRKNLSLLNVDRSKYKIFKIDYIKAIKYFFKKEKIFFDVIFADPPYNKNYIQPFLNVLNDNLILNLHGIIILQHSKKEKFIIPKNLFLKKILTHGETNISIIERRGNE